MRTTDSVDSSGLETSGLPTSTAPPNSTMMLTLNWTEHSESASSENIRSALRELPVDLVRVDPLPEGRAARSRGTLCWLASSDTPVAEAELRRQLADPGSSLRRVCVYKWKATISIIPHQQDPEAACISCAL